MGSERTDFPGNGTAFIAKGPLEQDVNHEIDPENTNGDERSERHWFSSAAEPFRAGNRMESQTLKSNEEFVRKLLGIVRRKSAG